MAGRSEASATQHLLEVSRQGGCTHCETHWAAGAHTGHTALQVQPKLLGVFRDKDPVARWGLRLTSSYCELTSSNLLREDIWLSSQHVSKVQPSHLQDEIVALPPF